MAKGLTITWDTEDLRESFVGLSPAIIDLLSRTTRKYSLVAQNHARTNAPWTDRTGNARSGLFAKAYGEDGAFQIVLYHTMYYGIFLEKRWSGRWGIIPNTVSRVSRVYTAEMTKTLADLLKRGV